MKTDLKLKSIVLLVLAMTVPGLAFAGTSGTEFQVLYDLLVGWATGFLGKSIAIAAFIIGMGMGIARSSPMPALGGVVFALFVAYVPGVIGGIVTGVL